MLTFALIHVQLHGFSIGAVKCLVLIEQGLHDVFARRDVFQARSWITQGGGVNERRLARLPMIHRQSKNDLRARRVVDLHSWFLARVSRQKQQEPAVQRLRALRLRKLY